MIEASDLERRIVRALPGAIVDVRDMTGTADHYEVRVIAAQFAGLTSIERHRLVYAAVTDVLGGTLHALSLKTLIPGE